MKLLKVFALSSGFPQAADRVSETPSFREKKSDEMSRTVLSWRQLLFAQFV